MQWSEADLAARKKIADAQVLDKAKLLSLRKKFISFFRGYNDDYISSTTSFTADGDLPYLEQVYKSEGFEGREEWLRSVQEAWPGFDENIGRLNRANKKLADGLDGWIFSYGGSDELRHIRALHNNDEAQMEDKEVLPSSDTEDRSQVRGDLVFGQMLWVAQLQSCRDQIVGLP